MVYDVFPFFNEIDILKLRLETIGFLVDRFVIAEATHTFSGELKPLYFHDNREMFSKYLPKIEYIVVDDSPEELGPHQRDRYQKNHLLRGLSEVKDDDIIIFSDVDEIPNPHALEKIIANFDPEKVYHLAQRMFHGYLNREETSMNILSITGEFAGVSRPMWLGTKVFAKRSIPATGIVYIRETDTESPASIRVNDGGWHFSYMGGSGERDATKRVIDKIKAAAHQEYNDQDILAEVTAKTVLGRNFLGRDGAGNDATFVCVPIDETFPQYLREHIEEYSHLIMPEMTAGRILFAKTGMYIRRFFRKLYRRFIRFIKTGKIRR
ncbi:MAG: glycosyl transferase GT17 family protein [Lachnospiraceae bacterium]|jgi:beta-1,4-mannosyl-glycoprotein beta-1,4-N-acetylglucosaminyltransferase|nr:glycosyl transferase GT17 family protein [Lachnospiraceae bacterium]